MSHERPLFSDCAIQIVADNRIRAAIEAGDFDNLPGFGRPSGLIDEPYDPTWWIRRKLKREQLVLPCEMQCNVDSGEAVREARRRSGGNSSPRP
jgi:hypothetical protein